MILYSVEKHDLYESVYQVYYSYMITRMVGVVYPYSVVAVLPRCGKNVENVASA